MADSIQSTSPRLWTFLQFWCGGTVAKRRLARRYLRGQRRVLEIGCATGNLTPAFIGQEGIEYTGVDIDPVAIEFARRTFGRTPDVRFLCEDLRQSSLASSSFDYILLAGVLHHVDDTLARELLEGARRLLAPGGTLVVSEPLQPAAGDSWLVRQFLRVERGAFVRPGNELARLLRSVAGIALQEQEEFLIAPTPLSFPKVARFGVYRLAPVELSGASPGGRMVAPGSEADTG